MTRSNLLVLLLALAALPVAAVEGTAHDPRFDDRRLWPELDGAEYFLQQAFEPGRLYVWAKPGQNGGSRVRGLDPGDPANWLVDGEPATEVVFDERTDVLFPASDTPYTINFRSDEWSAVYRNVTVEPGCTFGGGGDGRGRQIHGNIWVKRGASIGAQGSTTFKGDQHTFVRNDNPESVQFSQYFTFNKARPELSVEFLGRIQVLDEFKVRVGTCIVGEGSTLLAGRNAGPFVDPDGSLVVLSGGYWGKWCNEWVNQVDLEVSGGVVQGGLPERPLTSDAVIGLSFRNWKGLQFEETSKDRRDDNSRRMVSAIFRDGATIRSIPAADNAARLVVTRTIMADDPEALQSAARFVSRSFNRLGDPWSDDPRRSRHMGEPAWRAVFDSAPRGTAAWFAADTTVEGVRFDGFGQGAFLLQGRDTVDDWRDVTFGPTNIGGAEAIVGVVEKLEKGGYW